MAKRDMRILKDEAEALYRDIMYQSSELLKIARTGTEEELRDYIKSVRADELKYLDAFALAMDWANLISTRFYAQGVDITDAMRERIYLDNYGEDSEDWQQFLRVMNECESERFTEYVKCLMGMTVEDKEESEFKRYIEAARAVNTYIGNEKEPRNIEHPKGFKELVAKLIDAKKHCILVANFTKRYVPFEKRFLLNAETITYDEAYEISGDIIDNIANYSYFGSGKRLSFAESDVEDSELAAGILSQGIFKGETYTPETAYEAKTGLTKQIMERFITKFLEKTDSQRRTYPTYMKTPVYNTTKKFILAMGLYCEPYVDLEDKDNTEAKIVDNLERFMNQNSFSIKSSFATVSPDDILLDETVLQFLVEGYTLDSIAFFLKNYAKTAEKEKNTKKATSK